MAKSYRTPNDQRSTVKNSYSLEYKMNKLNTLQQTQNCKSRKSFGFNESEADNSFLFLKDGELYLRFLI